MLFGRVILLHVLLLVIISVLLYLPILRHPHWGTFDDANIIVQLGRRLHDYPETYAYMLKAGVKRSGYFGLLMLLWKVAPENPGFYFGFNSVVFSATSVLIYFNALLLSKRPWLSLATTGLLFTAPGLFEVIYTLDKQEIYLAIFFSVCVFLFTLNATYQLPWNKVMLSSIALFLTTSVAYSFKETSGLLILFAVLVCLTAWITKSTGKKERCKLSMLLFFTLLPCALALLWHDGDPSRQYVSLSFDPTKILTKIIGYSQLMPLYFAATIINVVALILFLRAKNQENNSRVAGIYIGLTVCCIAAPLAFSSFDTVSTLLLYLWPPIYAFLLPATAFSLATLFKTRKFFELWAISSLILFSVITFPFEWLRGQFQLRMDTLTHEVAQSGARLCGGRSSQLIGALPTFSPMSYEVPENLEFFIRDQLESRYYDVANERHSDHKFVMLDFLTTKMNDEDLSTLRKGFTLEASRQSLCPSGFTGWRGYQLLAAATPYKSWVSRPFPKDSLLFIPYGNVPSKVAHRGWGLFGNDVPNILYCFPQLKLAEVYTVEKNISNIYGEKYKLGWKIFRVQDAQPISMPDSTSDSWLSNEQKIFYNSSARTMEFESTQPVSQNWLLTDDEGRTQKFLPIFEKGRYFAAISLSKKPGRHWLRFHNDNPSEKLHCDAARLTSK